MRQESPGPNSTNMHTVTRRVSHGRSCGAPAGERAALVGGKLTWGSTLLQSHSYYSSEDKLYTTLPFFGQVRSLSMTLDASRTGRMLGILLDHADLCEHVSRLRS